MGVVLNERDNATLTSWGRNDEDSLYRDACEAVAGTVAHSRMKIFRKFLESQDRRQADMLLYCVACASTGLLRCGAGPERDRHVMRVLPAEAFPMASSNKKTIGSESQGISDDALVGLYNQGMRELAPVYAGQAFRRWLNAMRDVPPSSDEKVRESRTQRRTAGEPDAPRAAMPVAIDQRSMHWIFDLEASNEYKTAVKRKAPSVLAEVRRYNELAEAMNVRGRDLPDDRARLTAAVSAVLEQAEESDWPELMRLTAAAKLIRAHLRGEADEPVGRRPGPGSGLQEFLDARAADIQRCLYRYQGSGGGWKDITEEEIDDLRKTLSVASLPSDINRLVRDEARSEIFASYLRSACAEVGNFDVLHLYRYCCEVVLGAKSLPQFRRSHPAETQPPSPMLLRLIGASLSSADESQKLAESTRAALNGLLGTCAGCARVVLYWEPSEDSDSDTDTESDVDTLDADEEPQQLFQQLRDAIISGNSPQLIGPSKAAMDTVTVGIAMHVMMLGPLLWIGHDDPANLPLDDETLLGRLAAAAKIDAATVEHEVGFPLITGQLAVRSRGALARRSGGSLLPLPSRGDVLVWLQTANERAVGADVRAGFRQNFKAVSKKAVGFSGEPLR